jgi:feruloyl-CoA synthase
MSTSTIPYRQATLGGSVEANFDYRPDGSVVITSTDALQPYPERITDRLVHFAAVQPEAVFAAKRKDGGDWIKLTYGDALKHARAIAQALIDRGLSQERPLAILSDNDLEHLLLAMGAMLAGVPYAPISPAYSLISQDYAKLAHAFDVLTPGLVFVSDAAQYSRAILAKVPADLEVVATRGELGGDGSRLVTRFSALLATPATEAVDRAHAGVNADTIAKFLFTSGSTHLPKAVINTQRMLCANQQMLLQCLPFLGETPPVLIDWLPWNHTFGGNHNIGIALYNGGTIYIDEGKPTPAGMAETLRNLREIAPTIYFNVPKGFDEIVCAIEKDEALGRTFLSRVKAFFFSGAGLSPQVWERLDQASQRICGERIRMLTGLGMTETAPFALCANTDLVFSGVIGLPAPGLHVKLVPSQDKHEVRYRGPTVTPGYWRAPQQTAESFDDEGYFCSGDAAKPIDAANPGLGLAFDGRISEDFKLSTGTFVSTGPLRARVIAAGEPYIQDVVIAGLDRDDIGILVFPRLNECRVLAGLDATASAATVLASPDVRAAFQRIVDRLWASGTGSATRVARARVMETSPSIDLGEVTDKGSINQRAVLKHRAALVATLYEAADPAVLLPSKMTAPSEPSHAGS